MSAVTSTQAAPPTFSSSSGSYDDLGAEPAEADVPNRDLKRSASLPRAAPNRSFIVDAPPCGPWFRSAPLASEPLRPYGARALAVESYANREFDPTYRELVPFLWKPGPIFPDHIAALINSTRPPAQ